MHLAILVAQSSVSYEAFVASVSGVAVFFTGAIGLLWRRIDKDSQKCMQDRENDQKERSAENKAWAERVEALRKEHALEQKALADRVEALHRERVEMAEKMVSLMVEVTKKSEEAKYAVMAVVTESSLSSSRVETLMNQLSEKAELVVKQLFKQANEQP